MIVCNTAHALVYYSLTQHEQIAILECVFYQQHVSEASFATKLDAGAPLGESNTLSKSAHSFLTVEKNPK